jgi:hypothetical protein
VYHQLVFSAKRDLNAWIAQHLPALADNTNSHEAEEMVLALSRFARLAQIQLSAMQEQWTQDEWTRRNQHTDSSM